MTILHSSLSATVLIVVIVLVRRATLHKLPKNTFCVLWTAAALRLLLLFSIEFEYSFFTFFHALFRKNSGGLRFFAAAVCPEKAHGEIGSATHGLFPLLKVLWLVGFCVITSFFLISYIRSMGKFRHSVPVSSTYTESLPKRALFPVRVRQSGRINGPLTYGFFRPVILLPYRTDWDNREQLSFILAHEYAHIRRHDCLAKLLFAAALCVHWFNPAVWLLCRLANRDIELACDETTIRSLGEAHRFSYARTLLGQTERAHDVFPLFSHFGKHAVEERVTAALKPQRRSVWRVAFACLLVAGTLTAFGTSAAKVVDAEETNQPFGVSLEEFYNGNSLCIGFRSGDPSETFDQLRLTTPEGEAYPLTSRQSFSFWLDSETVARGVVNGCVMEMTPEGDTCFITVASAEFRLISQEPLACQIGDAMCYLNGAVS